MPSADTGEHSGWFAAVCVGVLAIAAQLATYDRTLVSLDEGQLMNIAVRLNDGEVLYRDIYSGIFPGVYYVTAWLLALGGTDLVVTRWAQVAVNAATALCLWTVTCRIARPAWAALSVGVYLFMVVLSFPVLTMFNYSPLSLLFALFVLVGLLRYIETGRTTDGLAVGALLAGSALTKQNFGGLAFVAVIVTYLWTRRGTPIERRSLLGGLVPIGIGGATVTGLTLLYFMATGALPSMLHATLVSIRDAQLAAFNDPIPPIFGPHPVNDGRFVLVYTPPTFFNYLLRAEPFFGSIPSPALRSATIRLAYGGTLGLLVLSPLLLLTLRGTTARAVRSARAAVAFAILLFFGIFPSAIWSHLAYIIAPVLPLLGGACDRVDRFAATRSTGLAWGWRIGWAGAAVLLLVAGARLSLDVRRWHPEPSGLAHASVSMAPDMAARYRRAAAFIEECAEPATPIFVAPDIPMLYVITGHPNPTPFDLTIPGDVDGPAIVERLEATGTRCVVYKPKMYAQFAPFEELFPTLVEHLDSAYTRTTVIQDGQRPWHGLVRSGTDGTSVDGAGSGQLP